jgi:hypothetical protein
MNTYLNGAKCDCKVYFNFILVEPSHCDEDRQIYNILRYIREVFIEAT